MIHSYRLKQKTVTASLGILALSLGILGDVSAADIKARPGTNLEQLAQRYTMQSERRIHESLGGGPAAGGHAPAPAYDDDLGGNVELF